MKFQWKVCNSSHLLLSVVLLPSDSSPGIHNKASLTPRDSTWLAPSWSVVPSLHSHAHTHCRRWRWPDEVNSPMANGPTLQQHYPNLKQDNAFACVSCLLVLSANKLHSNLVNCLYIVTTVSTATSIKQLCPIAHNWILYVELHSVSDDSLKPSIICLCSESD